MPSIAASLHRRRPKTAFMETTLRQPNPAYAKMTDDQLIICQNILEKAMDRLEEMDADWSPEDEQMHKLYTRDALDIEREQSSRWRDLMESKGS